MQQRQPYGFLVYFVTVSFLFYEMALQVAPSILTTTLMSQFHLSTLMVGILSGCYFITYTLMQIPSGILFDKYPPRWIIFYSIITCVVGNIVFSHAHHFLLACLGRLLMGLGSAFAFVAVLVVTKDCFEERLFPIFTGITQALAAIGAMAGQLPIHFMIVEYGWRHALDYLSIAGFVIAIMAVVVVNYQRPAINNTTQNSFDLFSILKQKKTWLIGGYAMLTWAPMAGIASLWGIPYLQTVKHMSAEQAAFTGSLMWVGLAIFSPLLGTVSNVFNNRNIPMILTALVGFIGALLLTSPIMSTAIIIMIFILLGASCSGQVLTFTMINETTDEHFKGAALAVNNMAVVLSGTIIQPVMGAIIANQSTTTLSVNGLHHGMWLVACCYLIAAMLGILLRRYKG